MKKRTLFLILFTSTINLLIAQDTIQNNEVYYHKNIAYKNINDEKVNGIVQKRKKNGQLKWEELYVDGIRTEYNVYFRMKEKKLANKYYYFKTKPYLLKKEIKFSSGNDTLLIKEFDINGKKKKIKRFRIKDNILIYSCEYKNGKKHGKEIIRNCNLINQYINGKKIN